MRITIFYLHLEALILIMWLFFEKCIPTVAISKFVFNSD
ncbi:hypothetical protein ANH9381_0225 [Aggregatibacter actinomycetemcomitans ANH9381]|nr:hypothetical protein ANH9381_0225 [Aggregatibacter actinomycetemcomitans ANH9381]